MDHLPLIICGSAQCLWADLEKAASLKKMQFASVGCINYTALYYPYNFDFWFSWHVELLGVLSKYVRGTPLKVSCRPGPGVTQYHIPGIDCTDSGLMSVLIGLEMSFDRIILCGCPIDNSPKFYSPSENHILGADNIQQVWERESKKWEGKVRSFSGNTKKLLGEPTQEWINE